MSAQKRPRSDDTGATSTAAAAGRTAFAPLRLSVGGTMFTTTRETLCAEKGSMLATKFEEDSPFGELVTDDSGAIFLDTDPTTFAWILGYLRRGCVLAGTPAQPLLDQVRADADYFGLVGLVAALDGKLEELEEMSRMPTYEYEHVILGPLTFGDGPEDEAKRMKYERCLASINANYAAKGWRVAHAAVDAAGEYVDCVLERKAD